MIVDGQVLRGANGFAAEIGHFQIDPAGPHVRVRRARALGGDGVGQRARADGPRAAAARARRRASSSCAGRRRRRDRRSPRQRRGARRGAGRARARRPVQLQRRDRARRAGQHLRPGADRDRRAGSSTTASCSSTRCGATSSATSRARDYRPTPEIVPADGSGSAAGVIGAGAARARPRPGAGRRRSAAGEARAHPPVVRRGSGDPARGRARGRGRRACTASSCTTTCSAPRRSGELRPALECTALLGAVAAETRRIAIGHARRRARRCARRRRSPSALDTVLRIAGAALLVGLGAGDEESRRRDGDVRPAVRHRGRPGDGAAARRSRVLRDRGYPIWVGGRRPPRRARRGRGRRRLEPLGRRAPRRSRARPAEVRALVERLGRDPAALHPVVGRARAARPRPRPTPRPSGERFDPAPNVLVGGPERVADGLRGLRRRRRAVDHRRPGRLVRPRERRDPRRARVLPLLA